MKFERIPLFLQGGHLLHRAGWAKRSSKFARKIRCTNHSIYCCDKKNNNKITNDYTSMLIIIIIIRAEVRRSKREINLPCVCRAPVHKNQAV